MKEKSTRYLGAALMGIVISYQVYHWWLNGFRDIEIKMIFFPIALLAGIISSLLKEIKEFKQTKNIRSFSSTFFGLFVILVILGFYYYLKSQKS
jgi:hypothetical protein